MTDQATTEQEQQGDTPASPIVRLATMMRDRAQHWLAATREDAGAAREASRAFEETPAYLDDLADLAALAEGALAEYARLTAARA